MIRKLLPTVLIMAPLALFGCQKDTTAVAVRFARPVEPFINADPNDYDAHLVAFNSDELSAEELSFEGEPETAPFHVTLWGGKYNGQEVTHENATLDPGHYTFAFWGNDRAAAVQGWMRVNSADSDLVDVLRKWRASLPVQKKKLAYEFEVYGKLAKNDPALFRSFKKQLRAVDRLQRQIDGVIARELKRSDKSRRRREELIDHAVVQLLPGDTGLFTPTTDPAFRNEDLATVRQGQTVTKLLLVADYEELQWKLQLVNQVGRSLQACKNVLREEVDRLERRKRLLNITDHLNKNDHQFTRNEYNLQQTLVTIGDLNDRIASLREKRVALAFVSELVAPDSSFAPLDDEQRDLMQERVVLEAERARLDTLFAQAAQWGSKRVHLERRRQRALRALEATDAQLEILSDARIAIASLKSSSEIIHRHGGSRLLAASFVGNDIPFRVKEAIEREALMSVRLEAADSLYVPSRAKLDDARTASHRRR